MLLFVNYLPKVIDYCPFQCGTYVEVLGAILVMMSVLVLPSLSVRLDSSSVKVAAWLPFGK